eukprot:761937-Hanusia_phi.AAC.1
MFSEDPTLERSFRGHKDAINSVVFNPNMKQLISGSQDSCLMIWNFKPQLRAFRFSEHTHIRSLSTQLPFRRLEGSSPRAQRIERFDYGRPTCCEVWSVGDELNVRCHRSKGRSSVIKAHNGGVRCVSFSPDSSSIMSASDDKTLKVDPVERAEIQADAEWAQQLGQVGEVQPPRELGGFRRQKQAKKFQGKIPAPDQNAEVSRVATSASSPDLVISQNRDVQKKFQQELNATAKDAAAAAAAAAAVSASSRAEDEQVFVQAQSHSAQVNEPAASQTCEQEALEEEGEQAPTPALAQALSVEDVLVNVRLVV